jgi:tetratricopeptide (TPR) repeat protein
VLLLLDYWPLDRLEVSDRNKPRRKRRKAAAAVPCPRFSARLLLAEKVPLFLMSAVVSVITYASVHAGRVISDIETVPLNRRLANAAVSYVTYIAKMLWPARLAVFYPYPRGHYSVGSLILSILLLVLITVGLAYAGRTRRYLVTGWLWYVGVLVPVIGLIQAGAQSMADRYMYLPMVGLLLICVWGFNDLLAGWRLRRTVAVLSAVVLLPAASVCTRLQLRHWQNSEALFRRALSVTSDNYVMHNNYANLLHKLGKTDLAIEHYRQCLRIRQDSPEAHNNLGNALTAKGLTDEAVVHYNRAIQLARDAGRARGRPAGLAEAHHNLANALRIQGRFHEARQQYNEALKIRPDNPDTLRGLGLTLAALKMFDEAVRCYDRAIEIEPDNIISRGLLGLALANKGMTDQAIEQFRLVLDERPNDVEMLCNLGVLLESQDKTEQAIRQYERALKADPAFAKAQHLLEVALKRRRSPQQSDPLKTPAPTPRDPPSSAPN